MVVLFERTDNNGTVCVYRDETGLYRRLSDKWGPDVVYRARLMPDEPGISDPFVSEDGTVFQRVSDPSYGQSWVLPVSWSQMS